RMSAPETGSECCATHFTGPASERADTRCISCLPHLRDQVGLARTLRIVLYLDATRRKVDLRVLDAIETLQCRLDPAHAGRAGELIASENRGHSKTSPRCARITARACSSIGSGG